MMFALCPACSGRSVTIPGIVGHDRGIPDIYPQRASVTITGMTGHDPPEYPAKQERLNKQGVSTVETPLFDGIFDSGIPKTRFGLHEKRSDERGGRWRISDGVDCPCSQCGGQLGNCEDRADRRIEMRDGQAQHGGSAGIHGFEQ